MEEQTKFGYIWSKARLPLFGLLTTCLICAVVLLIVAAHLKSTTATMVKKQEWTVVNTHGDGYWLIVQSGRKQMKLRCTGSLWHYTDDDGQDQVGQSTGCYPFATGDVITLEDWGDDTFIYKKRQVVGEDDYTCIEEE